MHVSIEYRTVSSTEQECDFSILGWLPDEATAASFDETLKFKTVYANETRARDAAPSTPRPLTDDHDWDPFIGSLEWAREAWDSETSG